MIKILKNINVLMIVGISCSAEEIIHPKESPVYIVENNEWRPFSYDLEIEKGSILDFLTDPPAGIYGRVVEREGHLILFVKGGNKNEKK